MINNIKAKYFTAESREAAEAMALAYFKCSLEELTIDIISGDQEYDEQWQILAIKGTSLETNHMNASYAVYYEEGGVYLEIYPARGRGVVFDSNDLIQHLNRKNIADLSVSSFQKLIEQYSGRTIIAKAQAEYIYGEDLHIVVAGDELQASARLLPPESGGARLDVKTAKLKLAEAGITHGIDEAAIAELLEKKDYGEPFIVARATPPIDGEDGKLIFHFSTDERTGAPRVVGAAGRVDYHSLDLYIPVSEGQLLVSRTLATEGQPGKTVKGKSLKQRPGKEAVLPRSKNVAVNTEKTEMTSTCSGLVAFINNTVSVSNVYKINGNVDMSVGNIDFEGSVQISGNVQSGHTVKATDNITVGGGVGSAKLIAGGDVEVKGGMQGAGKGMIEAGGSVTIMYVEQGTVAADGPVKVDVCIHSIIETSSTIHALGKRGAIIGGRAAAAGDIIANYIGALSGTKTEAGVGVMPRKRARLAMLEKEMTRLSADGIKLNQLDEYLKRAKGTMPEQTWEQLRVSSVENRRINAEDRNAFSKEIAELKNDIEHATNNRIHVYQTAFSGSLLSIGKSSYKVTDDISYATFRYSDGEVVYGPCELSQADKK